MSGCIYLATCTSTKKVYVGQTQRSLEVRKSEHIAAASKDQPNKFGAAIKKFRASSFRWKVLETSSDPIELNFLEHQYIIKFKSHKKGYNSHHGNDISTSANLNANQILNICKMYKNTPLLCTSNNKEFESAKYAASALGVSEQDIILACRGYYRETAFNHRFEFTDSKLQAISNKLLRIREKLFVERQHYEEYGTRPVYCESMLEVYYSISFAAECNSVTASKMRYCCTSKSHRIGGYKFNFV